MNQHIWNNWEFRYWSWRIAGCGFLIASLAIMLMPLWSIPFVPRRDTVEDYIAADFLLSLWPFFVPLGLAALYCLKNIRRYAALSKYQRPSPNDSRPPILYLRTFHSDRQSDDPAGISFRTGLLTEEHLADAFKSIGPFVAIGAPNDVAPPLGASRIYVGEDWRERVRSLMEEARLVIIRAGDSPGLWCEIELAAKDVTPDRLFFLLPFNKQQYEEFRQKAQDYLPSSLPTEYSPSRNPIASRAVRAILYFDKDWTAHIINLKAPLWHILFYPGYSIAVYIVLNLPQLIDIHNPSPVVRNLLFMVTWLYVPLSIQYFTGNTIFGHMLTQALRSTLHPSDLSSLNRTGVSEDIQDVSEKYSGPNESLMVETRTFGQRFLKETITVLVGLGGICLALVWAFFLWLQWLQ